MTRHRLTSPDQLRDLPDDAVLTTTTGQHLIWLRAYARPHPDPDTGLWRLPRNPFTEWHTDEIDADLPDATRAPEATLVGDEPWISTLHDPHDTTEP